MLNIETNQESCSYKARPTYQDYVLVTSSFQIYKKFMDTSSPCMAVACTWLCARVLQTIQVIIDKTQTYIQLALNSYGYSIKIPRNK